MTPRAYILSLLPVISSNQSVADAVNRKFNTRLTASRIAMHRPRSKTPDQRHRESVKRASMDLAEAINNAA